MGSRAGLGSVTAEMTAVTAPAPAPSVPVNGVGRIAVVDVLRGVAIVAVVVFHLTWDLGDLHLINLQISLTGWGRDTAHTIAASFLFLVGVSLVLAHGERFRARSFCRREAELVAYGALVTVATWVAFPSQVVTFGILQAIAVSSVLALPFVRAPRLLAVGAGLLALVLPQLVTIPGSSRWWSWTGLTASVQPTVDHAPLLPWCALTLLGLVTMRSALQAGWGPRLARWRAERGVGRALAYLGRHTLGIYLAHQLVLLPVLTGMAWLTH